MVAFGPSASFCLRSLAASHEGCSGPVDAAAGGAGVGRGVNAGRALGENVVGGLAPVLDPAVVFVLAVEVVVDEAGPAGLPATAALFPYALAILPSVACALAF